MKVIKPSVELLWVTPDALSMIELAGRTCYKSEDRITQSSAPTFIANTLISKKHFSVLEHASASFRIICDRGISHEIVRHRLAAYSQESTRYCNYGKSKFGGEIQVIEPPFKNQSSKALWAKTMREVEGAYLQLLGQGEDAQFARCVLPTCLKTELVMTCNFREWLHVFELRTASSAHPQVIEIMSSARTTLANLYPCIFSKA